jgi:CheY-like chemotaxis protein
MTPRSPTILIVEDNQDDVFLMRRALKAARIINPIQIVDDGQKGIEYLRGNDAFSDRVKFPFPGVLFLDLQLPHKTGFDVLEWIKTSGIEKPVIIVLSSSNSPYDMERCCELGADHYAVKPPDNQLFDTIADSFELPWILASPGGIVKGTPSTTTV